MPTISVIVPVYKVEPYLHRCVDSILNQTFQDFELILVDDGSPDNCGAICDEYAAQDSRIHVIHQENGGLSAARNAGIDWAFANSDSEWLGFVDSDDWIHLEFLERMLRAANQTNTSICACGLCHISDEADVPDIVFGAEDVEIREVEEFTCNEYNLSTNAPTKIYRKRLFQNHRYPLGKLHEDAFLTYLILFQEAELAYIPRPMYYYFQSPDSITRSKWNVKKLDNIEAHKEQVRYFKEHNYMKAYDARTKYLAGHIIYNLKILNQSEIENKKKYQKLLIRELRTLLRQERTVFDLNDGYGKYCYQNAYPTAMQVRRFFQRKIRALQTLGVAGIVRRIFKSR